MVDTQELANAGVDIGTKMNSLEQEIVAPGPEEEMPGLRKFMDLLRLGTPESPTVMTASGRGEPVSLKRLVKWAISFLHELVTDSSGVKRKVAVLSYDKPDSDILSRVTLSDVNLTQKGADNDMTLAEMLIILAEDSANKPAAELITLLTKAVQQSQAQVAPLDAEITDKIIPLQRVLPADQIERIAEILGISPRQLESQSTQQVIGYFAELVRRVGEIEEFASLETSLLTSQKPNHFEVAMLNDTVAQTGVECVLYATLNIARAAVASGAILNGEVTIQEMAARVPIDPRTGYRDYGAVGLSEYLQEKGFKLRNEFTWLEAISLMREKRAALFASILADHALAVVGVRFQDKRLQFLVSNSLPNYWPQTDGVHPVWIPAQELIAKTELRPPNQVGKSDMYLIQWDRIAIGSSGAS